ncbi:hypothetical protein CEXT_276411 [Caerostris extrusa]|uniref:Uncharacterized protein n=1 Tax=Caerostris extrusa TaxID=172846 RepID=A0AAV4PF92_CAEEX|nr:hypothetical protein CEXT_276411 [Caerostris extrusa]
MLHSVLNNPEFECFTRTPYLTRVSHCSPALTTHHGEGGGAIRAGKHRSERGCKGASPPLRDREFSSSTTAAGKTAPLFTSLKKCRSSLMSFK